MTLHLSDDNWAKADAGMLAVVDGQDTASQEIVGFARDEPEAMRVLLEGRPGFYGPAQSDCTLIGVQECNPVELRNRDGRGVTLLAAFAPLERWADEAS